MAKPTAEEMADRMFKLIDSGKGIKKYKAGDLQKAMKEIYGEENVDRQIVKNAIRLLIDNGRCVYTYFGGSFIEVPHREGSAND